MQFVNNSTTNKIINYYSNFMTVIRIVQNGKKVMHAEAQSFEIPKLRNPLEKSSNPLLNL